MWSTMRAQSSVEFLATYSFLFLILGVMVSVLVFIAMGTSITSVPQQCTASAGPNCNYVSVYSNKAAGYSLVTFSITNSQGVPIDITSMNTSIKNTNYPGTCSPSFLYPGQQATCISNVSVAYTAGVNIQGSYYLTAGFCNSGVSGLQAANCAYDGKTTYGGTFLTSPISRKQIIFSVIAAQSPRSAPGNLIPYTGGTASLSAKITSANAINSLSLLPNNYTILQNGDFVSNVSSGTLAYAFATNGAMLNQVYLSLTTGLFPSTVSSLDNGNIGCSTTPPFNSVFSVASTALFLNTPAPSFTVAIETGGAMEVFYRRATNGGTWQSAFGGGNWKQGATAVTNSVAIPLSSNGLYDISVAWSDPCGAGAQVLKITSITS